LKLAKRVEQLPPYLFVEISRKIAQKRAKGEDVISLGAGDPDFPTPQHILDRLCEAARDPANHHYPATEGLPELRRAIAQWYEGRFGIILDPDKEVLPVIGSKEGLGHIPLCFIDPGDIALVPDPAYPVYSAGVLFAGGSSYPLPLVEENNFLPDLDSVPQDVAQRAKMLWINYPNNPTGAVADMEFFQRVVAFSKKYDIPVCHDGPYTEVAFDGYRPLSFMQAEGSREVGVEFHSLSKSYNMTGWRIGMVVGNADMVNALMRVKSNLDSGIPQAIQYAAIAALTGPQGSIQEQNAIYKRRQDKIIKVLLDLGLRVRPPVASLYIWAGLPEGQTSIEFAERLLEQCNVVVTPGIGYGQSGEGYIRISLTCPDERIDEALTRIRSQFSPVD